MGYQRRVHGDPHPSSAQQSTTSAPTAPAHQTTSKTTINNNTINMTDDSRKGLGDSTSNIPSALSNTADTFHRGPGEGHASGEQVHNRQGQGGCHQHRRQGPAVCHSTIPLTLYSFTEFRIATSFRMI